MRVQLLSRLPLHSWTPALCAGPTALSAEGSSSDSVSFMLTCGLRPQSPSASAGPGWRIWAAREGAGSGRGLRDTPRTGHGRDGSVAEQQ